MQRLAAGRVGGIVLYSLFEEQLRREAAENARLVDFGSESFARSSRTSRRPPRTRPGPGATSICSSAPRPPSTFPLIGSLNGVTPGWSVDYAAIKRHAEPPLNIYHLPADTHIRREVSSGTWTS